MSVIDRIEASKLNPAHWPGWVIVLAWFLALAAFIANYAWAASGL